MSPSNLQIRTSVVKGSLGKTRHNVKIQKTKVSTLVTNLMKRLFKANEADQDEIEIEVEDVAEENKEVSKWKSPCMMS